MPVESPEICYLPTCAMEVLNSGECIRYLPSIAAKVKTADDVQRVLQHIVAVINHEISPKSAAGEFGNCVVNQVVLNTAYRAYFHLLQQYEFPDTYLNSLPQPRLVHTEECGFQMLYAILLTDQQTKTIDPEKLRIRCTKALIDAVNEDCDSLLVILKVLNLLLTKFPKLDVNIPLQHIYYCLQSNQFGMREETITLFTKSCRQSKLAFQNFQVILEFWPWTNRYKYYLLSCILRKHNLIELLKDAQGCLKEFYAGVRLSLSHKRLLAASQYLVKALSGQRAEELLRVSAEILTRGTLKEIQNFYSHWYARIEHKDRLFELLQEQPEVTSFLENTIGGSIGQDYFRSTLIFSMFSRQIFFASKLHFFKISTELITNCFHLEMETQMLVFKFIVDNLRSFAIEDCLEFTAAFIKAHKCIENAQYRNEILGKLPTIINYVAKTFNKLHDAEGSTTLEDSIRIFFQQIQLIIEADIGLKLYQPKIFALRLLDILLKSLYGEHLEKNAKNCCLAQNRKLGVFLIEQNVFEAVKVSMALFNLFDDPLGFDDALELVVMLLQQINYAEVLKSMSLCKEFSRRCDVDECVLSAHYARVTLQCSKAIASNEPQLELFNFAVEALKRELTGFQTDPLFMCKTNSHLFGYINIIKETVQGKLNLPEEEQDLVLDLLEMVLHFILDFLNLSKDEGLDSNIKPASFQDMDESLELLVRQSAYKVGDHEECRKFLLMSFWLTLKATCDLATEIGSKHVEAEQSLLTDLKLLERCLKINVAVLTCCRHKGAIEAAGISIGKLTKSITSTLVPTAGGYVLLENCLELLFDNTKQISVTRRGAGYSIMLLHIVKNEQSRLRPLLRYVMEKIIRLLKEYRISEASSQPDNCDRFDALLFHYLGVLVRDTELRDGTSQYYNDILLVTFKRIEHPEWTEFNAAMQIFGALIPKIVGQNQVCAFDADVMCEYNEITYDEIVRKLPTACEYILSYLEAKRDTSTTRRTTILFLGFLSKVGHLRKDLEPSECRFLDRFRVLMWRFLAHRCENVRKLAALCFVRAHDFTYELPQALVSISNILYCVHDENMFLGLVFTLSEGVARLQYESLHTIGAAHTAFLQQLRSSLNALQLPLRYKPYTLSKLLNMLLLIGCDCQVEVVRYLLQLPLGCDTIGYDVWQQSIAKFEH